MSDSASNPPGGGLVDHLKGAAKELAGAITGNDDLKHEGELHHDKADAAKEAAELQAQAAQEQERADLIAREQEVATEQQRLAAETAKDSQELQAEREKQVAEARVETEATRSESAVEQQKVAQDDALDRQERQVTIEANRETQDAAALRAEAEAAKQTAVQIDTTSENLT